MADLMITTAFLLPVLFVGLVLHVIVSAHDRKK